jgi:hypothetical protein
VSFVAHFLKTNKLYIASGLVLPSLYPANEKFWVLTCNAAVLQQLQEFFSFKLLAVQQHLLKILQEYSERVKHGTCWFLV